MIAPHRHCPGCGISTSPEAQACPDCYVGEVREALDRLRRGEHVDVDQLGTPGDHVGEEGTEFATSYEVGKP